MSSHWKRKTGSRRSGPRPSSPKCVVEVEDTEAETNNEVIKSWPKKRGRPPKKGTTGGGDVRVHTVMCMSFPVTEHDDDEVQCKLCSAKMTFRNFRIHNIKQHYNIAITTDDSTLPDHKFYDRQLKEFAKFTKLKVFHCPVKGCGSSYKSTLGLAYHLETCGKTKEEIDSCLLECEVCKKKFTLPNLGWHKKTHKKQEEETESGQVELVAVNLSSPIPEKRSRMSAVKARQSLLKTSQENSEDESENLVKILKKKKKVKDDDYIEEAEPFEPKSLNSISGNRRIKQKASSQSPEKSTPRPRTYTAKTDFAHDASAFITANSNLDAEKMWDIPERVVADPLSPPQVNPLNKLASDAIKDYLPSHLESISFKIGYSLGSKKLASNSNNFQRLSWLKGLNCGNDNKGGRGNLVFNAGGPILGMSWHSCGHLLAVSTGKSCSEDIDYKIKSTRKGLIHIYGRHFKAEGKVAEVHFLKPRILIAVNYGYATHIQWSNFWPSCWNKFDSDEGTFKCKDSQTVIGHLACSFEDGSTRVFILRMEDMSKPTTFQDEGSLKIPVYGKVPEIVLQLDSSIYPKAGQVCKFQWHEKNQYIIVGYCSGVVAIFDIQTKSPLLTETNQDDGNFVKTVNPFWSFQAHLGPVTGVCFDPASPRYFITASKDRFIKLWDLRLRQELESRKVGLIRDICWIRGWISVAVTVDAAISNMSSQHNFVRFFQLGSSATRPNCAEFMNVTSLTFHEGLTIQATESGNITATYFDKFWREMDFDRNKKKHNVVNICSLSPDTSSFEVLSKDEFPQLDANYTPFVWKDQEPRVVLKFMNDRVKSVPPAPGSQGIEDFARFASYLTVNKVCWCPTGKVFAAGYRNGLLVLVPADFHSLYIDE